MRAALMLAALTVAAPHREPVGPRPEAPKTPRELVVGDWLQEKVVLGDGDNLAPPPNTVYVLRITPTDMIFMVNGQPSLGDAFTSRYSADWSKNPTAFDLLSKEGSATFTGILKLEGDRLIVATGFSGASRPNDFGSARHVGHYRRIQR